MRIILNKTIIHRRQRLPKPILDKLKKDADESLASPSKLLGLQEISADEANDDQIDWKEEKEEGMNVLYI